MLLRLWRLLRPQPEPDPYAVPYRPLVPLSRPDPAPERASDHYPPLTHKLSPIDAGAAAFDGERQPGDEIWAFCSPMEDWQARGGRSGAALVRNGYVIRSVTTLLN